MRGFEQFFPGFIYPGHPLKVGCSFSHHFRRDISVDPNAHTTPPLQDRLLFQCISMIFAALEGIVVIACVLFAGRQAVAFLLQLRSSNAGRQALLSGRSFAHPVPETEIDKKYSRGTELAPVHATIIGPSLGIPLLAFGWC